MSKETGNNPFSNVPERAAGFLLDTRNVRNIALAGMVVSTADAAFGSGNIRVYLISAFLFTLTAAVLEVKSKIEEIYKI